VAFELGDGFKEVVGAIRESANVMICLADQSEARKGEPQPNLVPAGEPPDCSHPGRCRRIRGSAISERTRAALAAAKARGIKLGDDRGARLTAEARQAYCSAVVARADARAHHPALPVRELQAGGARSLRAIAAQLNQPGVRAPRGVGRWQAGTVSQLLQRLPDHTLPRRPA
jgi:hypothetical protein